MGREVGGKERKVGIEEETISRHRKDENNTKVDIEDRGTV